LDVPNAPTNFNCFHVTTQRIVMTGGSLNEARLIQWSDSEDREDWTPTNFNQAGFQIISGTGKILEIATVQDVNLIVTETDAHIARYLGPPYVYGFDRVGDNCGALSGASVVATENFAVWPGKRNFFLFDGQIKPLQCDVMDELADAFNGQYASSVVGFVNPNWSEAWWLYPDETGAMTRYVAWDWTENNWTTGFLTRTVGFGTDSFRNPGMIGEDALFYRHELLGVVPNDIAEEVSIRGGAIEIAQGEKVIYVESVVSDFVTEGAVDLYLHMRTTPTGPVRTTGPIRVNYPEPTTQPIPIRAFGHLVELEVRGASAVWSLGELRLGIRGGGRK